MKLGKIVFAFCLMLLTVVTFSLELSNKYKIKNRLKNKLKNKLKSKHRLRLKHRRSENLQDLLSKLDKAQNGNNDEDDEDEKKNKTMVFRLDLNNRTHTRKHPWSNPDILLESKQQIDLVHDGWLKISSPSLKENRLYPRLTMPDWTTKDIAVERNFFRLNKAFDPFTNDKNSPIGPFYFYFRLSRTNLYYAQSKNSVYVLGSLMFKNVRSAMALPEFARQDECFVVDDADAREWTLCAPTVPDRNEWVCLIRSILGQEEYNQCKNRLDADANLPVIVQKITKPMILIPLASPFCNQDFTYNEHGADWECDCREGKEQSPVDLPNPFKAIRSPVKPVFDYKEVDAKNVLTTAEGGVKATENLQIKLRDHALKINAEFGQVVTIDGSVYKATEIVFHTPAEHTIDGRVYDMEMQIIHHGQTKGDIAKQVILSFLFEKKPGVYNKFIDDIDFFSLPNPLNKERDLINNLFIPKVFYNSESQDVAMWKPFSFYTYQGSLTAPPCTERTIVYVAAKPIPLGTTAIGLFQEALRMPDLMADNGDVIVSNDAIWNNRSIQNRNGRVIYYYDADAEMCPDGNRGKHKKVGHYEKIDRNLYQYYYVNGPKPSGMPGAIVVSPQEALGGTNVFNAPMP